MRKINSKDWQVSFVPWWCRASPPIFWGLFQVRSSSSNKHPDQRIVSVSPGRGGWAGRLSYRLPLTGVGVFDHWLVGAKKVAGIKMFSSLGNLLITKPWISWWMFLSTFHFTKKVVLVSKTARTFIGMGESSHLQPFWMGFAFAKKVRFPTPSGVSPFHSFKRTWEGNISRDRTPWMLRASRNKNVLRVFFRSGARSLLVGEEWWWGVANQVVIESMVITFQFLWNANHSGKVSLKISFLVWWRLACLL